MLLACCALTACVREEPPPRPQDGPDLTLTDVTLRHTRAGRLKVRARAPKLEMFRFSGDLTAFDAGVFVAGNGVELDLPRVTGNLQAGVFTATDARLTAPDGTTAHSAALTWRVNEGDGGVVTSDAPVEIDRPGLQHQATGFRLDLASERAEFTGPSTVVTSPP